MKRIIIYEFIKRLKQHPELRRKLKTFVLLGAVGIFITGGLLLWAGFSAISYVVTKTNQAIHSSTTQLPLEGLKAEISALPRLQVLNCWEKAQSLIAIEPWLARPAIDNLTKLKAACLDEVPALCEQEECSETKQMMDTEGRII